MSNRMKIRLVMAASLAVSLCAQTRAKTAIPDLQGIWTNATLTQL